MFLISEFFLSNSSMRELFKIFASFLPLTVLDYSCKEDYKINMLKKFERFITISLAVLLV